MTATVHTLPPARTQPVRAFQLVVRSDPAQPDRYGVTVQETYRRGLAGVPPRKIATAPATQARHVLGEGEAEPFG